MKIGFQIVLFLLILNIVSGLAFQLNVPGTQYSHAIPGTGDPEDYEDRFNAGKMLNETQPGAWAEFPFLGNVFGTIMMLWNGLNFIIMGFPALLERYAGFIPEVGGRTAFSAITLVLRAIFSFVIFGWIFQILTGRETQE